MSCFAGEQPEQWCVHKACRAVRNVYYVFLKPNSTCANATRALSSSSITSARLELNMFVELQGGLSWVSQCLRPRRLPRCMSKTTSLSSSKKLSLSRPSLRSSQACREYGSGLLPFWPLLQESMVPPCTGLHRGKGRFRGSAAGLTKALQCPSAEF